MFASPHPRCRNKKCSQLSRGAFFISTVLVESETCNFPNASSGLIRWNSEILTTPLFANKSFLTQKYTVEGLSARQIAVLIGSSHSTINSALIRLKIAKEKRRSGWLEYGIKFENGRRVQHVREQKIIESMVNKRSHGWSYNRICKWLESRGIRSPSSQKRWFPGSVKRLITGREIRIKTSSLTLD